MSDFVLDPSPLSVVRVADGGVFPVRRIFCVGKNYADHVAEMGGEATRDQPVFFTKPADAVVASNTAISYPPGTNNFHFEGELVVALKSGGRNLRADRASIHVFGYAAGCDLTRRDLQAQAKAGGNPWDMAKGFDHSAPVGAITRAENFSLDKTILTLTVNDEVRQRAALDTMIWSVADIIAALSTFVELCAGDLIFTGTPAGVGPLAIGDRVNVSIGSLSPLDFSIGEKTS